MPVPVLLRIATTVLAPMELSYLLSGVRQGLNRANLRNTMRSEFGKGFSNRTYSQLLDAAKRSSGLGLLIMESNPAKRVSSQGLAVVKSSAKKSHLRFTGKMSWERVVENIDGTKTVTRGEKYLRFNVDGDQVPTLDELNAMAEDIHNKGVRGEGGTPEHGDFAGITSLAVILEQGGTLTQLGDAV